MGTHARVLSYARIVPKDFRAPILIAGRWRRTTAKLRHTALFVYLQFVPPTAHFHFPVLLPPRRAILTGIKRNQPPLNSPGRAVMGIHEAPSMV